MQPEALCIRHARLAVRESSGKSAAADTDRAVSMPAACFITQDRSLIQVIVCACAWHQEKISMFIKPILLIYGEAAISSLPVESICKQNLSCPEGESAECVASSDAPWQAVMPSAGLICALPCCLINVCLCNVPLQVCIVICTVDSIVSSC